jgi:hypothetical protein
MKIAITFLSKSPQKETIDFGIKIYKETKFDVFIISDEENTINNNDIKIIAIKDSECKKHGYINSNISNNSTHIKKNPIAWDKMLYYFCLINQDYDFVWVFEEDCFIPNIEVLNNLNKKYNKFDLITPNNFLKSDNLFDWHWKSIIDKIAPPYYYSMVCGCGISKNLFKIIKKYVERNNELFYIEVMFNTLANHHNLKVKDAFELKSIVWMGKWEIDEWLLLPNNIFHPKKELSEFENYRKEIENAKKNNYQPINTLPDFLLS